MLDTGKLTENIIDQIKEAQIKLGYAKESMGLYYPLSTLNSLLGTDCVTIQEMYELLKSEAALAGDIPGKLAFSIREDRIGVRVSADTVEYIHHNVETSPFLVKIVELFMYNHHCTLEEVKAVFAQYGDYACEKMPEGEDFDYVLYYPEGKPDSYYYCIKAEMGHTIYHRFAKTDYDELMRM